MGFVLAPEQARELIERDSRNNDVLFPYLNGEDLNSRPDCSASRWVINFHDWPEEQARSYPEVFDIVERLVKPVRMSNNRKVYRDYWWQYAEKRPAMIKAISGLDRVLAVALVSKTAMPSSVPTGQVFSHMLGVFTEGYAGLALPSSSIHYLWASAWGSSLKGDLRYTPSDVYETFPQPDSSAMKNLTDLGRFLSETRSAAMLDLDLGLTKLYSKFHDPTAREREVIELRNVHAQVDQAVTSAYGWEGLDLEYVFQKTKSGSRRTFNKSAQAEILDLLLELNQERHGSAG
ncbi:type IIL restriction-modification enzyme MmeI [Streptomyces sp. NPDC050121]|uniref:type IIL restriction-modification enzyme MmeI n=1 Tax=Streptomyces sp. NPDC050121 TaxID=3365601 RepID=UPI0037B45A2D